MVQLLGESIQVHLWYSLPLIVVVSIVFGATRHEYLREIIYHATKSFAWLMFFMFVIFILVWWFSRNL